MLHTSQDGINLIESFEGCRLEAYQDSVQTWTIGYGHTADVVEGMTITPAQATALLAGDLVIYEHYVNSYVTAPLTQHEFDALVSFTYNLGAGTLQRSDLLAYLNADQIAEAADMFLEYDHAGGVEVAGLLRRREAERALFLLPDSEQPLGLFGQIKKWLIGA